MSWDQLNPRPSLSRDASVDRTLFPKASVGVPGPDPSSELYRIFLTGPLAMHKNQHIHPGVVAPEAQPQSGRPSRGLADHKRRRATSAGLHADCCGAELWAWPNGCWSEPLHVGVLCREHPPGVCPVIPVFISRFTLAHVVFANAAYRKRILIRRKCVMM